MYLKRLDLAGFKSFANRTTLTFEPGITVLCGPNGSGKSNISDAVRWALGEQSVRAIRGRRGEDVIFVGSQGRQPLGLAEVSLTLDNTDGRVPLDYDEVRFTRRLYRSGEAEYLVNGTRVRLRDVHQWLLHAALDPHAYVVVGQGSVDELILQRPEERRAVLENAADIRRHQARLAETRAKLSAAEENLARCRVVIAELEPHVRRLRSQAERASRYRAVHGELVDLAGAWFSASLARATAELESASAAAWAARREVESREARLAEIEASMRNARVEARSVEEALAREETELSRLYSERARLAREIAVATERRQMHLDATERWASERRQSEERLRTLDGEVAERAGRVAASREHLEAALEAARHGVRATNEQVVREAEQRVARLRRRDTDLEVEAAVAQRSLAERGERARAARRRAEESAAGLAAADRALEDARRRAADLGRQADECRSAVESARQRLASCVDERAGLGRRVEQLRKEQHRLAGERQRLDIARRALEDVRSAGSGASVILDSRLAGVVGLLGGQLRVPRDLQAAIGAALDDSAHAVVVESAESARAGLDLLAQRGAERVGLAPLDGITEAPPIDVVASFQSVARAALEGLPVRGFADELVVCEQSLDAIRARCLGMVVVVPDLETAREAARRLARDGTAPAPWQVVTLQGHAIRWNGVWRGGRDRGVERLVARRDELLALERNAAEVAEQYDLLARELRAAEVRLEALAAEESQARELLQEADEDRRQAIQRAESAATDVSALEREVGERRQALSALRQELARLESEIAELDARRQSLVEDRSALAAELQEAERAARAARSAWEKFRQGDARRQAEVAARRSALQAEEQVLARLRTERASVAEAVAHARKQAESYQHAALAEAKRLNDLVAERAMIEASLGPCEEAVAGLRERRGALIARQTGEEERAAELRAGSRGEHDALEAATIAEARAAALLERVRRESDEWLEELGLEAWPEPGHDPAPREAGLARGMEATCRTATPVAADETARRRMVSLRRELRAIGAVNEGTLAEFESLRQRHEFLTSQLADLERTVGELRRAMDELQRMMRAALREAFARMNAAFGEYFGRLFGGGHAELVMSDEVDLLESGVEIVARPPGKRLQPLVSLSGGERALTMVALIFALLKTNPAPFCLLDEVDAALDDANVIRFTDMLRELSDRTQFIVVSHNRGTMEAARALYGVTMDTAGVSHIVSLRLPT